MHITLKEPAMCTLHIPWADVHITDHTALIIVYPAPCVHPPPPPPHSTQQTSQSSLKKISPITSASCQSENFIITNHNKTINCSSPSLTNTNTHQHQRIKPKRKSQEQGQNINKVKAKLSQSQLFKRIR